MDNLKPSLSVVVITLNEEKNIVRCLGSLSFSKQVFSKIETIVVDAESKDKTASLARSKGAKVFVRAWKGYSDQKNWAFSKAGGDWVLSLDADEELTPELVREIGEKVSAAPPDLMAFSIKRRAFFLGKWIRHCGWWPDSQLRLFRRGTGRFSNKPVHEGLEVKGKTQTLWNPMNHYTYDSISSYLEKLDRYTDLTLINVKPKKIRHWKLYITLTPGLAFVRMFVLRLGFLDGWHGFVVCALSAYHEFSKIGKLWEKEILKWKVSDPRASSDVWRNRS